MRNLLSIATALLLGLTASAQDRGTFICLRSEQAATPCECPHEAVEAADDEGPALEALPCCLFRAAPESTAAVAARDNLPKVRAPLEWVAPAAFVSPIPPLSEAVVAVHAHDPPSARIYLRVRHLLI